MSNNEKPSQLKLMLLNAIFKTLYLILTFAALSVGLAFYFLVDGSVGYGVGVAMFVVTALTFVIGEICFYKNMAKFKELN